MLLGDLWRLCCRQCRCRDFRSGFLYLLLCRCIGRRIEVLKCKTRRSYDKIENSHLLKLDDYESKAATIVSSYFLSLNFEYEDFAVFNSRNIKRGREDDNDTAMKKLNKAFLTYIYTRNINNIQKVQILIKSIMNVPNIYRYSHVINGAIEQIHLATQNNYKRFYLENIKQ